MICRKCGKDLMGITSVLIDGMCQDCFSRGIYRVGEAIFNYKCICGGEFNYPSISYGNGTIVNHKCPFCARIMKGLDEKTE